MVWVEFRIKHFNKTFNCCAFISRVSIQVTDILKNVCHFVNCVVTAFRSGAMARYALYVYADFHTATLTTVDTTISRFSGYYEFRTNIAFFNHVFPAKTIAVFFLYCTYNKYAIFIT